MTHTPGPWKLTGGGGVSACMESETLKSGRRVSRRVACATGVSIPEVEANARLIASAPNMLAALQGAELIFQNSDEWRESGTHRFVRDAIAKATGEQP